MDEGEGEKEGTSRKPMPLLFLNAEFQQDMPLLLIAGNWGHTPEGFGRYARQTNTAIVWLLAGGFASIGHSWLAVGTSVAERLRSCRSSTKV